MTDSTPRPASDTGQTGWLTSSFTGGGQDCVEVRSEGGRVHIRDTKYRRDPANDLAAEPIITITATQWTAVLDEVMGRAPAGSNGAVDIDAGPGGTTVIRSTDTTLTYTRREWAAFLNGVRAGELTLVHLASAAA